MSETQRTHLGRYNTRARAALVANVTPARRTSNSAPSTMTPIMSSNRRMPGGITLADELGRAERTGRNARDGYSYSEAVKGSAVEQGSRENSPSVEQSSLGKTEPLESIQGTRLFKSRMPSIETESEEEDNLFTKVSYKKHRKGKASSDVISLDKEQIQTIDDAEKLLTESERQRVLERTRVINLFAARASRMQ